MLGVTLTLPLFELRRFNGVESYKVEMASCNSYQREGATEAVFVVTTSGCNASLLDTEGLRATPSIEIGFRTCEPLSSIFTAGAKYSNLPEYDEDLEEWMTNLYYCEHQGIDNVTVEIAFLLLTIGWLGSLYAHLEYSLKVRNMFVIPLP